MMQLARITVAVVLGAAAGLVHAQAYPTKPVRMVIHIGPGSSMDIIGRVLAQKLNETWGQPVIVDNRPGAGGTIGMDTVAKAPPDGSAKVVDRIAADVTRLLKTPEMRERFTSLGVEAEGTTPAAFKSYFRKRHAEVAEGR